MHDRTPSRTDSPQVLAFLLLGVAAVLVVAFRFIPYQYRMLNFVPAGAMFLYAGSRLRSSGWLMLPFIVLALTDVYFLIVNSWPISPFVYASYALYLLLGWWMLRSSENPFRIGVVAAIGSVQFFLISNFSVWFEHQINPSLFSGQVLQYPGTIQGLLYCFEMGLPYFQGTILGDLAFGGLFFGAHALLARAWFPAERLATSPTESMETQA